MKTIKVQTLKEKFHDKLPIFCPLFFPPSLQNAIQTAVGCSDLYLPCGTPSVATALGFGAQSMPTLLAAPVEQHSVSFPFSSHHRTRHNPSPAFTHLSLSLRLSKKKTVTSSTISPGHAWEKMMYLPPHPPWE